MPRVRTVLVTGPRAWRYRDTVWQRLDEQRGRLAPGDTLIVVHGAARSGADHFARQWVEHRQAHPDGGPIVREWPFPRLPWEVHHAGCAPDCVRAVHREHGHMRNAEMVDEAEPDLALVFILEPARDDQSRGTKGCHKLLHDRRIPAIVCEAYLSPPRRRTTPSAQQSIPDLAVAGGCAPAV